MKFPEVLPEGEKLLWCSLAYPVLQNLAERKKKSLSERAQAEEEMEEIRRSYQQELDKLRQLLKKARTSTDQAAAEQVSTEELLLQPWRACGNLQVGNNVKMFREGRSESVTCLNSWVSVKLRKGEAPN